MNPAFTLHPRLSEDCITLGRFGLCRLLLMNDSHYPWFILVPEKSDLTEIYQLSKLDRMRITEESSFLTENLADLYRADKMNIAAIGNLVPQLHIHHIVRYKNDAAWPAPVWGRFDRTPYTEDRIAAITDQMHYRFKDFLIKV
ncbi:HIT domain-containing protein [Methylomicrobium sp. Wu6]|uniref:HIT domain-containing protein n=1 Tax=Methylomicrobium sp. Wu6 TaxID=3107928 RepID=UPI002DD64090|nr:HIT domain-containing protein [Methylomicrobium sp. Wu6]MEC4749527.1 HIT domain-containing protein [Methylomicrobium sp. Wu6]